MTRNLNLTPIHFNSTDPNAEKNDTQIGTECPFPDNFFDNDQNNNSTSSKTFDWTAQEQGVVLGCFYYGFVTTMLPGAFLGEKFGGKWILNLAIFGGAICSLLSPLVVNNLGLWGYVTLRIIQGLLQGPTSPLGFTILAKWLPVKGGFISESFSLWLKSPKMGTKPLH